MGLRSQVLRPRVVIAALVLLCAGVAAISLVLVSDSADGGRSQERTAPGFDPSAITRLSDKDDVPPLDNPRFQAASRARWLAPQEPVIAVQLEKEARAYPLQILSWHEIVNDSIGEQDFVVTFCPHCNTSAAFRRPVVNGNPTTFGNSGEVYKSNLLLYDRATKSLWQQMSGDAVTGELSGSKLFRIPAPIVSFGDFLDEFPGGRVLSRNTGFDRPYGENPRPNYDTSGSPLAFDDDPDPRFPALERVLGVRDGGESIAFPFSRLSDAAHSGMSAANEILGGKPIVVLWRSGAVSAQDAHLISRSRVVGSALAFSRVLGNRELSFAIRAGQITDDQTHTTWSPFGRARSGPLKGEVLTPVVSMDSFWFEWAAFNPDTDVWPGR